jgi:hypothetical protein
LWEDWKTSNNIVHNSARKVREQHDMVYSSFSFFGFYSSFFFIGIGLFGSHFLGRLIFCFWATSQEGGLLIREWGGSRKGGCTA